MSADMGQVQLRPREESQSFRAKVQFRKSQTGPPKMEGYLKKRTAKLNVKWFWRKYWFVLDGKSLLYFKSQSNYNSLGTCKGLIDFGLVQAVRPTHDSKNAFPMEIITRSDVIYLSADDCQTREIWVVALQGAIGVGEVSWPYGVKLDVGPQLTVSQSNDLPRTPSSGWSPGLGERRRKTASLLAYDHLRLEGGDHNSERRPSSESAVTLKVPCAGEQDIKPTKKGHGGMLRRARSFSFGFKRSRLPGLFRNRTPTEVSRKPRRLQESNKQTPCGRRGEVADDGAPLETETSRDRAKSAATESEELRVRASLNVNPTYQEIVKRNPVGIVVPEVTEYSEVDENCRSKPDSGVERESREDGEAQYRKVSKDSVEDASLHIYQEVQRSPAPSPKPSPRTVFIPQRVFTNAPDIEDEDESFYSSISEEDLRRPWSEYRKKARSSETELGDDSTYTTADPNDSAEELAETDYFEDNPHIVVTSEGATRAASSSPSSDAIRELREFLEYLGSDEGSGSQNGHIIRAKDIIIREMAHDDASNS